MSKNKNRQGWRTARIVIITVLLLVIALLIAGTAMLVKMCLDMPSTPPQHNSQNNSYISQIFDKLREQDLIPQNAPQPQKPVISETIPEETETQPPETTMPEPEHVVTTATIASTGDVLMHMPLVDAARQGDGSYNFDSMFQYLNEYAGSADYAVANLETTLRGTENGGVYAGYPAFNTPDSIADSLADAGFDMLLTANNHSYDTSLQGYKRTIEVVREKGLTNLGSNADADEAKYVIENINDISVGMLCYTYATSVTGDGRPSLNGMAPIAEAGICNYFTYDRLDSFYSEVETYLNEMRDAGAEATVLYIHWGIEYQLKENDQQRAIAQKLCDLGIDVIIGGHPHVVQPVDLLTSSEDPDHKTVVLYSMGNAVSNQRKGNISSIATAHTEDGVLFSITFSKYSDGTVYLESVELIPCWVNMVTSGARQYIILPLDEETREDWQEKYKLSDISIGAAEQSFDRTMEIVGEGLSLSQEYLAQQKEQREADYLAAVMAPAA